MLWAFKARVTVQTELQRLRCSYSQAWQGSGHHVVVHSPLENPPSALQPVRALCLDLQEAPVRLPLVCCMWKRSLERYIMLSWQYVYIYISTLNATIIQFPARPIFR